MIKNQRIKSSLQGRRPGKNYSKLSERRELHHRLHQVKSLILYASDVLELSNFSENLLRTIWRKGKIANDWRREKGILIPKEETSKEIEQYRIISQLNVESKIFFGILFRRFSHSSVSNTYISSERKDCRNTRLSETYKSIDATTKRSQWE